MAFAFDSLTYSILLRMKGVPRRQADAHAMAARDLIISDAVSRADLDSKLMGLREDMDRTRGDLEIKIDNIALRVTTKLALAIVAGFGVMTGILAIALR